MMKGWISTFSSSRFHILVILPVDGIGLGKQFMRNYFCQEGSYIAGNSPRNTCIILLIIERKASTNKVRHRYLLCGSIRCFTRNRYQIKSGPCTRQTLSCQYHGPSYLGDLQVNLFDSLRLLWERATSRGIVSYLFDHVQSIAYSLLDRFFFH
jgi:hypothetical protein